MSDHHHFNYIELPTTNMAAMKAFYADVFGWDYVDYGPGYAAITGRAWTVDLTPMQARVSRLTKAH